MMMKNVIALVLTGILVLGNGPQVFSQDFGSYENPWGEAWDSSETIWDSSETMDFSEELVGFSAGEEFPGDSWGAAEETEEGGFFAGSEFAAESDEMAGEEPVWGDVQYHINPLYEDVFTYEDLITFDVQMDLWAEDGLVGAYEAVYYDTVEEAAAALREQMVRREKEILVGLHKDSRVVVEDWNEIIRLVWEHTGMPKEGDSLYAQYLGFTSRYTESYRNAEGYWQAILIRFKWKTTPEMESLVDRKVAEILEGMERSKASTEYEKVLYLYHYLCEHTVYDHYNKETSDYSLRNTVYAALIEERATCGGYAIAMYRLALEAGVDCRYIVGKVDGTDVLHAWNILRIGNLYYNADPTWDAGKEPSKYQWFLRGDEAFPGHYRSAKYAAPAYVENYPTSGRNYEIPEAAVFEADGLVYEIECGTAKVIGHVGEPTEVVIPEEVLGFLVTAVGGGAFSSCQSLRRVVLPASLRTIHDGTYVDRIVCGAFSDCRALEEVVFPQGASLAYIGYLAFWNCDALKQAPLPLGLQTIGPHAFGCCDGLTVVDVPVTVEKIGIGAFVYITPTVILRNRSCEIYESEKTLPAGCVIYGYPDSTASAYAAEYRREFSLLTEEDHEHAFVFKLNRRAATCRTEGVQLFQCVICGGQEERTLPRAEHLFTEWDTVKKATCLEPGEEEHYCLVCGETVRRPAPPNDSHVYGSWKVSKVPTCAEDGTKTRLCSVCGKSEEEAVPATGAHVYQDWVVTCKSTCQSEGSRQRSCRYCGAVQREELPLANEHTFGSWRTTKEATVAREGWRERSCLFCGKTEGEKLPVLKPAYTLRASKVTIRRGNVYTIQMISGLSRGDYIVSWMSTKTSVCAVTGDSQGVCVLRAGKKGTAKVKAKLASGKTVSFKVKVK